MNPYHASSPLEIGHTDPTDLRENISQIEKQRAENRSRLTAAATTILLHLLVLAGFAWIILGQPEEKVPELEITEVSESTRSAEIPRRLDPRRAMRRAHPSASSAFDVVTVSGPAPIALTSLEIPTEAIGDSFGDQFGDGVDGFGSGGASDGFVTG